MVYISTLITVVVGILGVLFSQQGERQTLRPVGYVLIFLSLLSGALSILNTYEDKEDTIAERERLVTENRKIQAELTKLRLATFAVGAPPSNAMIIFDYAVGGDSMKNKYFSGPFPSFGKKGKIGRIWVAVPEIFEMHGDIEASLLSDSLDSAIATITPANNDPKRPNFPVLKKDPWFNEQFAPEYSVGANIKEAIGNNSMRKVLAEITPFRRIAYVELNKSNDESAIKEALKILRTLSTYLKFYVPLRAKDKDTCASVIYMPLRFDAEYGHEMLNLSYYIDEEEINVAECEKLPF
jgi:hypothetical protein